ncbi:MAG: class I SAM-dependent methyltransferase [Bacteroidales bacterium]|nr:class I SAM-dependent methyltransferase [Bacteroidales bacterium]
MDCGFEFTNPRPSKRDIAAYYRSENYISHSNKSQGLFARLYQIARYFNLASKYAIIKKHSNVGKALDIGSGTGHFLNFLEKKNWRVQGIEPDNDAAEIARSKFGLSIGGEEELVNLAQKDFDLITLWHVLEHVHDLNKRFQELASLIKSNGVLILALPNPNSFDAYYYDKYWAAYDVPRHLYHFTINDIQNLAAKHNFRVEKVYPMKLDAFYVALLSEKYRGSKLTYLRSVCIGFWSNLKSTRKNPNTSSLIYILRSKEA